MSEPMELCPKFATCNVPICPLDADWQKRSHRPGDATCYFVRLAAKGVPVQVEEAPTIGVATGRVLQTLQLTGSPSKWGPLRRALAAAAKLPPKLGRFGPPGGAP